MPKLISYLVLGIVFYLGVLLNISLLELNASEETAVKTISLILLLCVITLGTYLAVHKAGSSYKFYKNKLMQGKKWTYYTAINNTLPHQDFLDKIFKTYSIKLENDFFLRNIPEQIQMQNYLQQLIDYAKRIQ
ncbi:MAG: hypothetical protein ABH827_06715 [bacterium]